MKKELLIGTALLLAAVSTHAQEQMDRMWGEQKVKTGQTANGRGHLFE